MPTAAETAGKLFANRRNLTAIGNYSEADTVTHLIDPVPDFLGYPAPTGSLPTATSGTPYGSTKTNKSGW